MKSICGFLLSVLIFCSILSCNVEFSPNAEWKEVPVVYCLLDQDEDTTWARVEKCFLGTDDMFQYTQILDSLYYPEGSVSVQLYEWNAERGVHNSLMPTGNNPNRVMDFTGGWFDNKQQGSFSHPKQYLFYMPTPNLDTSYVYEIRVSRNTDSGNVLIANSFTTLVGTDSATFASYLHVGNGNYFRFMSGKCDIRWRSFARARYYQPMVRYFYLVNNEYRYVDVYCPEIRTTNYDLNRQVSLNENTFLANMYSALVNDTSAKGFADSVHVFIRACNEDLSAYMNSNSSNNSSNNQLYTNIEGGIGVFGARRTLLYKAMRSDTAVTSSHLHYKLKNLGIGF